MGFESNRVVVRGAKRDNEEVSDVEPSLDRVLEGVLVRLDNGMRAPRDEEDENGDKTVDPKHYPGTIQSTTLTQLRILGEESVVLGD